METIRQTYRILFGLEITLSDFPDDVNQFVRVTPDEDTQTLLGDFNVLLRKQKSTILSLIEVEHTVLDLGKPRVMLNDGQVFRFNVKVIDSLFLSRTHLEAYDFDANVLLLSNEVNHISGTNILLTRAIPNYSSSSEYKIGYLARSGSNYYKAIRASHSGDAHGVTETSYWKSIPDGSYLSQADLQPRPATAERDCHMIIEIKHSAALPADYQLLDGSAKCKEVNYKVKLIK